MTIEVDSDKPQLDKSGMLLILALGLAQGLGYLALTEWLSPDWREAHRWLDLLMAVAVTILPATAQWLMPHRRRPFFWLMLGGFAALILIMTWHTARVSLPSHDGSGVIQWFAVTGMFAWLSLMTLGEFAATTQRRAADYPRLFALAARNALLPLGAAVFTGMVYGLMAIWSGLFKLLGFSRISTWLLDVHLIWPLVGLVFAMATAMLIARPHLIDGARRVIGAVGAALTPLAALIILAFIGGVAVAGLKPLWSTGYATHLILLLAGIFTLFLNAIHDDGRNLLCLPRPLLILTRLAAALLPALIAISVYSLGLRIAQYGWTPERLYCVIALAFAAVVAIGYLAAALRPRAALPSLAKPNMVALAVMASLGIAANTPLLSPLNIAASDQAARILDGRLPPDRADWTLLATGMGQPGRDALEHIATAEGVPETVRARADQAVKTPLSQSYTLNAPSRRAPVSYFILPKGETPDPKLLEVIASEQPVAMPASCRAGCPILAIDLDGDGTDEMVLLNNAGPQPIYRRGDKGWRRIGVVSNLAGAPEAFDQMIETLRAGKIRTMTPTYKDIEIDGVAKRVTIYNP